MASPYFVGMQGPPVGHMGPMVNVPPPPMPPNIDPAYNNQPLQFGANSVKPPGIHSNEAIDVNHGDDMFISNSPGPNGANSPSEAGPMMQGMMGMPGYGPMMGDPSLMNQMMLGPTMGYGQFPGFVTGIPDYQQSREPLRLNGAVLMPPPPGAPLRTTRERPPGCRTIFVGGIPEEATEEQLREIFATCGQICSLRMSKKNFAHIRFMSEEYVDFCIGYSGWRLKVGEDAEETRANTGRIHVDYAQARDDQYEWECNQRSLAREYRHLQRMEEERLRPPSPPPVIHFSDSEATQLQEHLKDDQEFSKSTQVLITWLERGDCKSRTANTFYSLIQTTNSHVRRLMNEKHGHEEELNIAKEKFRQRMEGLLRQFDQIEKVFAASTKQKAWDHFSKAQRKNLLLWKNQSQEIRKQSLEDFLNERTEDNMDLSDSEDEPTKKKQRPDSTVVTVGQLKEENDSLKCQLEVYKNESDNMKLESQTSLGVKEAQLKVLQQALQNTQQHLLTSRAQKTKDDEEITRLRERLTILELGGPAPKTDNKDSTEASTGVSTEKSSVDAEGVTASPDVIELDPPAAETTPVTTSSTQAAFNPRQAKLVGVMATFLHVHPFGASTDYICSYLNRLGIKIRSSEIEDLLDALPTVFRQDTQGVGASISKSWVFTAFSEHSPTLRSS